MPKNQKSGSGIASVISTEIFLDNQSLQPVPLNRTIHWIGGVNGSALSDVLDSIRGFLTENQTDPIQLIVTSYGGPTGIGMCFYDSMRSIYKPNLITVGSGDVDSSGIIILLSGGKRFLTRNTTLFLHLAGRTFCDEKRLTVPELESIIKEDKLKDFQYASVLSEQSGGKLSAQDVLELMAQNTVLTASEAVDLGLAHGII